jgi:hypothetical protein
MAIENPSPSSSRPGELPRVFSRAGNPAEGSCAFCFVNCKYLSQGSWIPGTPGASAHLPPASCGQKERASAVGPAGGTRAGGIQAASCKFQYGVDLFPRDVELLDDFFDGGSGLEVFRARGNVAADLVQRWGRPMPAMKQQSYAIVGLPGYGRWHVERDRQSKLGTLSAGESLARNS